MTDPASEIRLEIECREGYLADAPILVAAVIENVTDGTDFYDFPFSDVFTVPGPIRFTITDSQGRAQVLPAWNPRMAMEEPSGITIRPGDTIRLLIDLSLLSESLPTGSVSLDAELLLGPQRFPAVRKGFVLATAGVEDHRALRQLRTRNDLGEDSWLAFLTDNWRTVDVPGLSPAAREALAYHLFLHRAAYGPDPVHRLEPDAPMEFASGPLEAEASILRLEILKARGDPEATAARARLLERWPGLTRRVKELERGDGRIAMLRREVGAERPNPPKGAARPYSED